MSYIRGLSRRLRQLEPDLVHTNSLKAAVYGGVAARLAGIPVIWHVRDRIADDYLPRPAVILIRALARHLPQAVIANSAATMATLPRARQASILYNPVIHDAVSDQMRVAVHRGGPMRIGVVGRLSPWKGQHVFLRAFASAFPDGEQQARLIGGVLFGEDDYETELHRLVDELGISERVEFRGFRDDVPSELVELDVLVHCSTIPEPFGQVVVEGMAAGLPVIAAAAGGPLEIIDDGRDGLLVRPGDVDMLAAELTRLAEDLGLRTRLGEAASASSARFSPHAAAVRLTAVYRQVLYGTKHFGSQPPEETDSDKSKALTAYPK